MIISKKNFHQILACLPVVIHQFLIGIGWGWTAPTLKKLRNGDLNTTLKITTEQASWMASINEMGRMTGPIITPLIVDRVGRRSTIVFAALSLFILWPSLIFLRDVNLIIIERLIFGITNGMFLIVSSIYTAENCSPGLRAAMGGILTVVYSGGYFVELILATYLSYKSTAIVNTIISACAFCTLYFSVETPSFLIMKEKYSKAEKNLEWLRGGRVADGDRSNEIETLKRSVAEERRKQESIILLFTSTENFKSICIVTCMYLVSAANGNSAINPYATTIFPSSQLLSSDQYTILYGLSNFISACLAPFIIPAINRRTILIASFSITSICSACTFLLMYSRSKNYEIVFYPWLVFASIALYGAVRAIYIPALYVIRAELLPMSVRAIGGSMAIIISSMTGFCTAKMFLPITEYLGMEVNFLFYSIMSIIMVFMIYYFLLETRGKSLDEIKNELKNGIKLDEFAKNESELEHQRC